MTTINESLIRDIVQEVLGQVGAPSAKPSGGCVDCGGAHSSGACKGGSCPGCGSGRQVCGCDGTNCTDCAKTGKGCSCKGSSSGDGGGKAVQQAKPRCTDCGAGHRSGGYGTRARGVFKDADSACEAAHDAFLQLSEAGIAARRKVIEIVKRIATEKAQAWGRLELEETKIGRLDHKIEKLQIIDRVPGVEFLNPSGLSGDNGITMEEYAPFGVIGAVTPSTHSIPTLSGNIVNMVAAGNAVVFNAHPSASRCAAAAVRTYNEAISRELGIDNLIGIVEQPSLESFQGICSNEYVRLIAVTGGPAVVDAAYGYGKRAICAGPGNPPVLVDASADIERAARDIVKGAAYDNNLLCIGEKEVFVVDEVADQLLAAMRASGAVQLTDGQLSSLTQAALTFPPGQGGGCSHAVVNKDLIGRDVSKLAEVAGASVRPDTQLLIAETDADHPFIAAEQMMPVLPIVRVRDVESGIAAAKQAEHGFRHTAIIHSRNVRSMTLMARALDTTLFVKNGPCMAGLGLGGEGYLSFTIATPTGEGVTNPKTFTRVRRCVMVDELRIY